MSTVYDEGLQGDTDPELLAACQGEGKVLLPRDLDFSNILVYPPERYAGLIVLRLHEPGARAVLDLLRRVVPHLATVPVAGRPWIADERRIRIRLVGEIDLGPESRKVPFA